MSVKERLSLLYSEIQKTALKVGRDPSVVTVIAIGKYASLDQIKEAYAAGIRHFGESRLQAFLAKKDLLPKDIIWHFIGPIQSNKAAAITEAFSYIHSISSIKVAKIVSETSLRLRKKTPCFLQINVSLDPLKQGFTQEEFKTLKEELSSLEGLSIQGLMTIGPYVTEENSLRECFQKLYSLQGNYPYLSMGMSGDFMVAIEEGSTHIRIGSYLFS